MSFSKKTRELVHSKYGGHCAYCGCEIAVKGMHVEHVIPKTLGGTNDLSNLKPSCRDCNMYKRYEAFMPKNDKPLENFRILVKGLHNRLLKIFIVKIAIKYGIIEFKKPFDDEFYFEKLEKLK